MLKYKYETHAHTSECSACATISARDLVRLYARLDYAGICITDHFFNGNTAIDTSLAWHEQVELLYNSYKAALAEGENLGLDVFWGWEYSFGGTDFLTYGLNVDWLYAHPEIMDMTINEYFDYTRSSGGFIVHAHPFREAWHIDMIRLFPRNVDAVEVINASMPDDINALARQYADNYNLLYFSGSDTHYDYISRTNKLGGISFNRKITDINDMIAGIKNGENEIF